MEICYLPLRNSKIRLDDHALFQTLFQTLFLKLNVCNSAFSPWEYKVGKCSLVVSNC